MVDLAIWIVAAVIVGSVGLLVGMYALIGFLNLLGWIVEHAVQIALWVAGLAAWAVFIVWVSGA